MSCVEIWKGEEVEDGEGEGKRHRKERNKRRS